MPQGLGCLWYFWLKLSLFKYKRQISTAWYQQHWQPFGQTSSELKLLLPCVMTNSEKWNSNKVRCTIEKAKTSEEGKIIKAEGNPNWIHSHLKDWQEESLGVKPFTGEFSCLTPLLNQNWCFNPSLANYDCLEGAQQVSTTLLFLNIAAAFPK